MTFNYSASLRTSWLSFIEDLGVTDVECDALYNDFKKFYAYLHTLFNENSFFKLPSEQLIAPFFNQLKHNNELKITTSDNAHTFLEYKKTIKKRLYKRYLTSRFTMVFENLDLIVDERKTKQAFKPNLIHTLDATYVRNILSLLPNPIITMIALV